ncbi:MAG: alanine dehydrogenase [Dehalococcoidales bacterium]|nr:alanine dehydrogenase [Dehalococcoidales bacterium]
MIIGVPKEVKVEEYRIGAPPTAVDVLVKAGHQVLVQATAGEGSGFSDEGYTKVGAIVVDTAEELYERAEMIYQVKEPIPSEYPLLRKDQIHYRYLHLAAEEKLTKVLMEKGVTAVAFETIETPDGATPCLDPMSAIAGRLATQVGAQFLGRMYKGSGKLLGGVPGVLPATVVILGGGVVGTNAAQMALGLGARVIMVTRNLLRLRYLEEVLHGRFETLASNPYNIAQAVKEADLLIGAVLVKGGRAPTVVTKDMVKTMKPGSVIVDVAIDQGGCIETSCATSHAEPIYIVDGVIHYCVTNMPGMVPLTSTMALSNATLPYALKLANKGYREAMKSDEPLLKGLNVWNGKVTNEPVAKALGLEYTPFKP